MSRYSVLTLRTLPRDDGRVSVVATREPAEPADPEVLGIEPTAVEALARLRSTVLELTECLGDRVVCLVTRYRVYRNGDQASGKAVLTLELNDGESVVHK